MASRLPERTIDEIRFRNDIAEVIGSYITLKRAGSSFKACCPFHKEKTPSFTVNPQRQTFKCFGCGEGGNVFGFLMKHLGIDFLGAVKMMAERAGVPLDFEQDDGARVKRDVLYRLHGELTEFYRRCLDMKSAGAQRARQAMNVRQLEGEVADAFMIGYAPNRWDTTIQWAQHHNYTLEQLIEAGVVTVKEQRGSPTRHYDRFRDRLMFPIHDSQGRIVGFSGRSLDPEARGAKYLNSPETPIFHKSRILYALDKARQAIAQSPNREAIVCEGQIDVIRCHQAGFTTAVASQGTAFTDEHAAILKRQADSVVIVFDSDTAGKKAALKTAAIFMDAGMLVRIAALPEGEDPDSFILGQGKEAFLALLDQAASVVHFQLEVLRQQEKDPSAISAISRMARALLETISHSPDAVQTAKLLEEAANGLGVPQQALLKDLEQLQARREAERDRGRNWTRPPAVQSSPPTPVDGAPEDMPMPDGPPPVFGEEEYEEDLPPDMPLKSTVMTPEERGLCELLVHHSQDRELVRLVEDTLPTALLADPLAGALLAAVREASAGGRELEAVLTALDPPNNALVEFADALAREPVKARGNDVGPVDAVRQCILRLWRQKFMTDRMALDRKLSEADEDEWTRLHGERLHLTQSINTLSRLDWTRGLPLIQIELHPPSTQAETKANG